MKLAVSQQSIRIFFYSHLTKYPIMLILIKFLTMKASKVVFTFQDLCTHSAERLNLFIRRKKRLKGRGKKIKNRIKCRHFARSYQVQQKYNTIGMPKLKETTIKCQREKISAHAVTKKHRIILESILKISKQVTKMKRYFFFSSRPLSLTLFHCFSFSSFLELIFCCTRRNTSFNSIE